MPLTQRRLPWTIRLAVAALVLALMASGTGAVLLLAQTPPEAPTGLVGDTLSDTEIQLSWQAVAGDDVGYRLERSLFNSIRWEEIASLDAGTTTYVDGGLQCDTPYFYRVRAYRSTDDTNSEYSELVSAGTGACPLSDIQPFSDTFSSGTLRPGWRFYDPYVVLGPPAARATLSLTGTNAEISVPGGEQHDLWRVPNNLAPRLLQPAPNTDFTIEVRFESVPSTRYQLQGIVVQESDSVMLRFDTYYTGSGLDAFAALIDGSGGRTYIDQQITDVVDQVYLRVIRTGDDWEYRYSADGLAWTQIVTFTEPLVVTEVGLFTGNASDPAPPYRASADYFMNLADPITDTDGFGSTAPPPPPATPAELNAEAQPDQVTVSWADSGLEQGQYLIERSANPAAGWAQIGEVAAGETTYADTSVFCGLSYEYRVRAFRAGDERISAYSEPVAVEMAACENDPGSPTIDVYYVDDQDTLYFGRIGNPARWLNVIGNVSDPDGLESVTYSVNGGLPETLTLGPVVRLVYPGDFNIELDRFALPAGRHVVQIQAVDSTGAVAYRNIMVDYTDTNVWPIPYSIDWREVDNITDVAQVIDGVWELTPEGLHVVKTGYDRLVAIGQDSWQGNFEAILTFTVHDGPLHSATGVVLGWAGHEGRDRPRVDWPLEALTWVNTSRNVFEERITSYPGTVWALIPRPDAQLNVSYSLHVRTERIADGVSRVAQRMWATGSPEPDTWDISADMPSHDGSLLIITHLADVTFHTIEIMPLTTDRPPTPPTPRPTITPRPPATVPADTPTPTPG